MLPTILCVADSRPQAEQIVAQLEAGNVNLSDTSVLFKSSPPAGKAASNQMPANAAGPRVPSQTPAGSATEKAPRTESPPAPTKTGTQPGAATGAAAGAAAAAATLALPGLQPLLVTAPFMAVAGAIVGALLGAGTAGAQLASFGIVKSRQDHYQPRIDAGGFLIAVRTEDEAALTRALRVFEQCHARDIELFRLTKKLT